MSDAILTVPVPENEPVLGYAPRSPERKELKEALAQLAAGQVEIPCLIGGKEVRTGDVAPIAAPHDHRRVLGAFHRAGAKEVRAAIAAAQRARAEWAALPWHERASVLLKAAALLTGPWRATLNAATMLGQSKTPHQAEIDSACELIDFWRFNPWYYEAIISEQPPYSPTGHWNRVEQRPLDGFVFAVTPFNFTSIAGNLPTAPALCGNTVVWKPASSAVYSGWFIMKLLQAAGLPDGVINFVPGSGPQVGDPVLASPQLAGIHFTGSTAVFQDMWRRVGANIGAYGQYPRIVGETGGKGFVFAHASADVTALVTALVCGAFEYQGQKCSAASRAFVPQSLWPQVKQQLLDEVASLAMGDVGDFTNFMGAVIDGGAFANIKGYVDRARKARGKARILAGGGCDDARGWFIEPTVIECADPTYESMVQEIFGPVLSVHVYPDADLGRILKAVDTASPYALTGAIFAQDRKAVVRLSAALEGAAGNFYVNDKPTGAVVGQQPFGGSRASGTNDKAGSAVNLHRWCTSRAVKENFNPPRDHRQPFMGAK